MGSSIGMAFLFAGVFAALFASPVVQMTDAKFSLLASQSLVENGTYWLDSYRLESPREEALPALSFLERTKFPRHLAAFRGHVCYAYPPGSSFLSAPFVAAMMLAGVRPADRGGVYDRDSEAAIQRTIAALLMAGFCCLAYATARLLLPCVWSLIVAIGATFGTQVWSTASRGLWSHTWGLFLLGLMLLLLVREQTGRGRFRPIIWATLVCWMYFVRPTHGVFLAATTLIVWRRHPSRFLPYAATLAVWLGAFALFSLHFFGKPLPSYYRGTFLGFDVFPTALLTHLVSPSRGLVVYVPVVLFITYLLLRYGRAIRHKTLLGLGLSMIGVQTVAFSLYSGIFLYSGNANWWAGHAYGPRTMTDLVPWFVLLGILGLDAAFSARGYSSLGRGETAAGAVLLVASIWMNGRGAISWATWKWNDLPREIEADLGRAWDWNEPQFLAGLQKRRYPPRR